MSISKLLTNKDGIVCEYHRVAGIGIDGQDKVFATVSSWISKERSTGRPIDSFGFQLHTPITTGLVATAETLLVADSTSPLFGGAVTPDVIVSDLDAAKTKKKAEIASARSVEMYADKTTSLGVFGSTESDNNKLSIAIQVTQLAAAAGQPAQCGYKTADGVYSVYTLAQLQQIALEIAAQVLPLYQKESGLVAQVDAATTVEEVEAVSW